jgi:hypothetical protein
MVFWPSVDGSIITTGWYAGPALMDASSPPNGTPSRRRFLHPHRRMIRQADVDGRIITIGWYAKQASKDTSSLPDGTSGQRWKITSPLYGTLDRRG